MSVGNENFRNHNLLLSSFTKNPPESLIPLWVRMNGAKKRGYRTLSFEFKVSGWKLSEDRKQITFTDKFKAGTFKLPGGYDLHFYSIDKINRVRIVRRTEGYYVPLCVDVERK